ncbi:FxDxF family PEP-CTERM protein [Sphingomonas sp. SM33]|uniref:FxDxF family PEP-CTERM protein n=1 Tax=Sphingomonas telluris TaxID=2907998 RepID=A0ABS9VL71_9SPHN|nr:FxDxF family PEP-CTERM protein [Sphingomonas telluris]MCH8615719.1 FxDxF family PEP-CTERM protein [Sphingomonas telluris]
MRKAVLALLGVATLAIASGAQAEITIEDPTTVLTAPIDETPGGNSFTFGYSDSGLTDPFTETLTFMNTLAGIYSFHVGSSTSIDGGPNDVDFSSILLTGTGITDPVSIPQNFSSTMDNDLIENFDLAGLNLGVGTFTLTIQGSTGVNGSFGGNVSFVQAAVPEPSTWAMMLVGFGAIGFAMRRRRGGQALATA